MDTTAIWLTLKLAVSTTTILFVLGVPLAYWLATTRWRGRFLVESVVALPLVLPPTVLGLYILMATCPKSVVGQPRLLLLDQPLSALDATLRDELRTKLRQLLGSFGVPVVVVTHDRMEAIALADQVIVMDAGRVEQIGLVEQVFAKP